MKKVPTVALSALFLVLAGTAFAEPPPVGFAGNATATVQDKLRQPTATDLAYLVGGERSHSCRTNALAGAVLATTGLALGSHWLGMIGGHLILLSETVCY